VAIHLYMNKVFAFVKKPIVLGSLVIIALIGGFIIRSSSGQPVAESVTVKRGTISQEVAVTGQVKPAEDLKLSFEKSGKIVQVYKDTGQRVALGQPIVALSSSELSAQLKAAQANVEAAQARLDALKRGARPEELALKQTSIDQANLALANAYAGLSTTIENSYINSDDAVRKQLDAFFTNDETMAPSFSIRTSDSQAKIDVESGRWAMTQELTSWRTEIAGLNNATAPVQLEAMLPQTEAHLLNVQAFLQRVGDALVGQIDLLPASVTTYQTSLTAARTEISTSLAAISSARQNLATDKLAISQAQNDFILAKAGSSPEDIRVQQAQVDAAAAAAVQVQVQIGENFIYAPVSGIITVQTAKVGQIVAPNSQIVEMISDAKFQIEADVPETDIGRVAVGDTVSIALDAFPDETFEGKVLSIDPAETIVDGAVNFRVKVVFNKIDPRIKSGFTANLGIQTLTKQDVLFLPQFAILQNDSGIFVEKMENGKTIQVPVTLGIRSKDGMVEITSGVQEGESVLNVGIKSGA
jgi:HlyD family secretion protein